MHTINVIEMLIKIIIEASGAAFNACVDLFKDSKST